MNAPPTKPTPAPLPLNRCGETLRLHPEGVLEWPARRMLIFTDPHFGKASTFQAAGLALPERATQHDLDRLSGLLHRTRARHLLCLGDFLHAASSRSTPVLDAIAAWRASWSELAITLVAGNHDRHAGPPDPAWNIHVHPESAAPLRVGPFAFAHEADRGTPAENFLWSGHLHPACRLGPGIRFPCVCLSPTQAILPAFGSVVGHADVRRTAWETLLLLTPDGPCEIPGNPQPGTSPAF